MPKKRRRHPAVQAYLQESTSKAGKARAASMTPKQRRKLAASGGKAAWQDVSPEERSARMRKVIEARWAKKPRKSAP